MNNKKHTIEEMKEIANQSGGDCLSEVYVNAHTKLTWRCNKDHTFQATPGKINQGHWCRICRNETAAKSRRISMEEITMLAHSRKGECLSKDYNPQEKLEWQCEFGHRWFASIHNVKKGHWCPICGHQRSGRKRLTIDEMHRIAANHGGECLSDDYENTDTKLLWKCKEGHIWEAVPSSIKKGHWCPQCAGNTKLKLSDAKELAITRGGLCLSTKFEGVHRKIQWQCSEGHTWFATYANVQFGRWCPECSSGIGERISRAFFEQIFGFSFPKTRPEWLINDDGNKMELDGYCENLMLAFEHQGRHHYEKIDFYYSSTKQFLKRKADDQKKIELCKFHNIVLILVPQIPDELPITEVQKFIIEKCRHQGVKIPQGAEGIKVDLIKAFSPDKQEFLSLIHDIAIVHDGECLSNSYLGTKHKLKFRCKEGHEWKTVPEVVIKGHWCPICGANERGRKRRLTIMDMDIIAKERGGKCLSRNYSNANTHLKWECSKGHQWEAIPNSIKRGSWCPICAKERKKIQTIK